MTTEAVLYAPQSIWEIPVLVTEGSKHGLVPDDSTLQPLQMTLPCNFQITFPPHYSESPQIGPQMPETEHVRATFPLYK